MPIRRPDVLAQLALALACAAGLALLQTRYVLGHDETWHVMFAEMQPWTGFLAEVRTDSHPPLSYLLLRLFTEPGAAPLAPRALSILAAAASPFAAFVAARGLGLANGTAHLTALLLAVSLLHVTMGIVVRGYALAHLLTWMFLAAWVRCVPEPASVRAGHRRLAVVSMTASIATLWASALVAAGSVAALLLVIRGRPPLRAAWCRALGTAAVRVELLLAGAGLAGVVALWLMMKVDNPFPHLDAWIRQPGEGVLAFLARGVAGTTRALVGLPELPGFLAVALGPVLLVTGYLASAGAPAQGFAVTLLLLLGAALALLGIGGFHPFGGGERHMSVLLAPTLLVVGTVADAALARLRAPWARYLLAAGCVALFAVPTGWAVAHDRLPDDLRPEFPAVTALASLTPRVQPGDAFWVHGYCRLPFYAAARAEGGWERKPLVDAAGQRLIRYSMRFAAAPRDLYFDRRWQAPPAPNESWTAELAALLDRPGIGGLWVLALRQDGRGPDDARDRFERWHAATDPVGLTVADHVLLPGGEAVRLQRR